MARCLLVCLYPGGSRVGHDIRPAALAGFGRRGELAVSASSPGGADSIAHLPAEPRAAAGDGRLSGSTQTTLGVSAGWIGK